MGSPQTGLFTEWKDCWLSLPQYNPHWKSGWDYVVFIAALFVNGAPFYQHGFILIPAWISNYIHYKVWDEIPYPFSNLTREKIENEWIISPHTTGHVITHQWRDWSDRYRDHWTPFIIKYGMKLLIHSQTSLVKNVKMNKWSHPTLRWAWAYFYMLS